MRDVATKLRSYCSQASGSLSELFREKQTPSRSMKKLIDRHGRVAARPINLHLTTHSQLRLQRGINQMKARYWSFEGRIARGTFWRGILSINLLTFAAFALVIILPVPVPWNIAAIIPGGLFLMFRTNVLMAQRLHDLGQPMRVFWSPWEGFRWMWAMSFSAGEQGVNAYGPPPSGGGSRLELVVLAGVLIAAMSLFRSAGFECKTSVSASGSTAEEANARWSEKVERVHGRRFAQSGIKLLTMTTCIDGSCSVSARACAFELAAATDERAAVEAPKRERASESGVAGTQQHSVMPAPAADSNLSNPAPIRGVDRVLSR